MKHSGIAISILMLVGSMKLIEYKATRAHCPKPISSQANIETEVDAIPEPVVISQPYQYSLIPLVPQEELEPNPEHQSQSLAWPSLGVDGINEALDPILEKYKKFYVLQRVLSQNVQTDIMPDYAAQEVLEDTSEALDAPHQIVLSEDPEEVAYAIDVVPEEDAPEDSDESAEMTVHELACKSLIEDCGLERLVKLIDHEMAVAHHLLLENGGYIIVIHVPGKTLDNGS